MAKYFLKKSTDNNLHTTPVFADKHYIDELNKTKNEPTLTSEYDQGWF